ncbi:MAG: helix-turn-helix transcriptional regulator [Acetatifactor sp.]|nr:helix-turn-helix transcriptional regulator [Acetatifactor sp.]
MNIGEVIKDKRQKRKLTQMELAELLKVTPQAVSKWAMGDSIPDIDRILVLFWFFEAV